VSGAPSLFVFHGVSTLAAWQALALPEAAELASLRQRAAVAMQGKGPA
jgi:hypothetical protein